MSDTDRTEEELELVPITGRVHRWQADELDRVSAERDLPKSVIVRKALEGFFDRLIPVDEALPTRGETPDGE